MTEAKSTDRAVQGDRERLFIIAKFIWLIENQLVMRTTMSMFKIRQNYLSILS